MSDSNSTKLTLAFWLCLDGTVALNQIRLDVLPEEKIMNLSVQLASHPFLSGISPSIYGCNVRLYKV